MNQRPKLRAKTVKFLAENMGNVHGIGCGGTFLAVTPKAQTTKDKIENLDFIKMKNLCTSQNTIKRVKYL